MLYGFGFTMDDNDEFANCEMILNVNYDRHHKEPVNVSRMPASQGGRATTSHLS